MSHQSSYHADPSDVAIINDDTGLGDLLNDLDDVITRNEFVPAVISHARATFTREDGAKITIAMPALVADKPCTRGNYQDDADSLLRSMASTFEVPRGKAMDDYEVASLTIVDRGECTPSETAVRKRGVMRHRPKHDEILVFRHIDGTMIRIQIDSSHDNSGIPRRIKACLLIDAPLDVRYSIVQAGLGVDLRRES